MIILAGGVIVAFTTWLYFMMLRWEKEEEVKDIEEDDD